MELNPQRRNTGCLPCTIASSLLSSLNYINASFSSVGQLMFEGLDSSVVHKYIMLEQLDSNVN